MTASKLLVIPILTCVLLLVDLYVWQAVKVVFQNNSPQTRTMIKSLFWGLTIITITGLWAYNVINPDILGSRLRTIMVAALFVIYGSKLFSIIFILMDDLFRLFHWSRESVLPSEKVVSGNSKVISRSEFLMKTAVIAASIPATALTWGILSGAHDYRIRHIRLVLKNLPKAFEGMTIAQISDIHSGSFFSKTAVKGGVEMLLKEKPDMVFFTGDLVNDRASKVKDFIQIFDKIKAPMGLFSTLGNHDYGVYLRFPSLQARQRNLHDIKQAHKILGYNLLLDENRMISLGGEKLAILGVENISAKESIFHNNGSLSKALKGTDDAAVKLLLSHDPTHWDKEVNSKFKDIDMMFSGHTHGLQLGLTIGDKSCSPAQWAYEQWAGLYQKGEQQLYVNRGFGYMGYPGRVGMPPEITMFTLSRVSS
ncbi:metallophosphoesterase [Catalinimonas niigatensis]|uniref:metallophosphoesterase n=1 Tax=Catalinimonas niigatensis TaxID=1397264 RepID=UPI002666E983|nr:metallophosphoesterase [Catalinimonas niigatensis]WPP48751.1 metallophosphoesterase [Catalinimonas niigatensis]